MDTRLPQIEEDTHSVKVSFSQPPTPEPSLHDDSDEQIPYTTKQKRRLLRISSTTKIRQNMNWLTDNLTEKFDSKDSINMDQFVHHFKHSQGFAEKLFELFDNDHNGIVSLQDLTERLSQLIHYQSHENIVKWFENCFKKHSREDQMLQFEEFCNAVETPGFIERLFQLINKNDTNSLTIPEIIDSLGRLSGKDVDWLSWFQNQYTNCRKRKFEGTIDYDNLKTVMKSSMDESGLTFSEDNLEEITTALFQNADTARSGNVSCVNLQAGLERYSEVINKINSNSNLQQRSKSMIDYLPNWLSLNHVKNNLPYVIFLVIFYTINTILFIEAAVRHKESGVYVSLARGGGACLNFNSVLILFLMFRQIITRIRSTPIAFLFPLDKYIKLHKIVGYTILFFSIEHFLAHIANLSWFEIQDTDNPSCNHSMWYCLLGVDTGMGWVGGSAGLTGLLLMILLLIMVVCSLPIVRRKGAFEVFYWSHNLFVLWYIILIFHAPHFWKWFLGPALIYIGERIFRSKIMKFIQYGRTYIHSANVLPSKVTHLSITRPTNFNFQPGDYVFIQIPAIAKYEWHPFTISSAPEMKDYLWLHIRGVGSWTNKLYDYFDDKRPQPNANEGSTVIHNPNTTSSDIAINLGPDAEPVQIHIDGPYGSPSAHIFQAEHAVLIASGIGVTPFASILQSIMKRFKHAKQTCPNCQHSWTGSLPYTVMKLQKVDFFWINRHQKHFEWFVNLLSELEREQNDEGAAMEQFLDMHMYITSAMQKTDVKDVMLQMALDMIHKEKNIDLITGLKTRTHPGRPNWDKVFKDLSKVNCGRVTVFFCGSPVIGKLLRAKCTEYGFNFRKENF